MLRRLLHGSRSGASPHSQPHEFAHWAPLCSPEIARSSDQFPAAVGQALSRQCHVAGTVKSQPEERTPDSSHDDGRNRFHGSIESLDLQEPVDSCLLARRLAQPQKNLRLHLLPVGAARLAAARWHTSPRGPHASKPREDEAGSHSP
jgi:hypothetical protein